MTTTKRKDKLIKLVDEKYQTRQNPVRRALEKTWKLNILGYRGAQWLEWSRKGVLEERIVNPAGSRDSNLVVNHIKPVTETRIAILTKNSPTIVVMPRSGDQKDIDKAKFVEYAIEFLRQKLEVNKLLYSILLGVEQCGTVFTKVIWDPTRGKTFQEQRLETRIIEGKEQEVTVDVDVKEGEIVAGIFLPFNVLIDPFAKDLSEATWIMTTTVRPIEEVRWKHKNRDIQPDANSWAGTIESEISTARGKDISGGGAIGEEGVIVKELYMAPCYDYPNGLYAKTAGGQLLEEADMAREEWPFTEWKISKNTDTIWGEAQITHTLPINQEYNKTRSSQIAFMDLMMYGQWVVPPQASIADEEFMNIHGLILRPKTQNREHHPYRIDPPNIPPTMFTMGDQAVRDIEEVSSIHAPMKGMNVPGGRSAKTIESLQGADQLSLTPAAVMLESSSRDFYIKALKLMKDHYEDDRILSFIGENGRPMIRRFREEELDFEDLRIEIGSSLPKSKDAEMQRLLQAVQYGLVGPEEQRQVLQALEIGSMRKIVDETIQAEENASREFDIFIEEGVYVPALRHQNHDAYRKQFASLMDSQRAKDMWNEPFPDRDGTLKRIGVFKNVQPTYGEAITHRFEMHLTLKLQLMQKQMMMMQSMQAQQPQGPQGPSRPSAQQGGT